MTATAFVTLVASPARAAVPNAPVTLPADIEVMPPYQPQTFCDPVPKPGIKTFAKVLTSTYPGTAIVSLARPCASGTSEHYDGRAIDWGVNVANDKQRAKGKAFIHWLLAADEAGNPHAMLRRLGIMYIIWNKRIWGGWSQSWRPYSCSGYTACHKDHMHLSFDWSGAMKKTSFWTGKVTDPMSPPLLLLKALHVAHTQSVSVRQDAAEPRFKVVSGGRYRFLVTGAYHYDGVKHHRADAECSTTDGDHWSADPPADTASSTGTLDLFLNGKHRWRAVDADRHGCSATHTYRRIVTFADKAPLAFSIDDLQRWGGDGSLKVTVQRVG
jgi:hypothetical protein